MLVGVLSLQGAVEEHIICLHKVGCKTREVCEYFHVRIPKPSVLHYMLIRSKHPLILQI